MDDFTYLEARKKRFRVETLSGSCGDDYTRMRLERALKNYVEANYIGVNNLIIGFCSAVLITWVLVEVYLKGIDALQEYWFLNVFFVFGFLRGLTGIYNLQKIRHRLSCEIKQLPTDKRKLIRQLKLREKALSLLFVCSIIVWLLLSKTWTGLIINVVGICLILQAIKVFKENFSDYHNTCNSK